MKKVGERTSLGEIRSLARSHGRSAINTLKSIMNDKTAPAMSRLTAAKLLLDRGFGKPNETHHIDVNGETSLLKVVNEIVHVYETREQIEFTDGTPLLERPAQRSDGNGNGNGSSTH